MNLTTLRDVGGDDELHRYLLGLALVAFTNARPYNLRQGCLLVRDAEKQPVMKLVNYDGTETEVVFEPSEVLAYAQDAANQFGVGKSRTVEFDAKAANTAIKQRREKDGGGKAKGRERRRRLRNRQFHGVNCIAASRWKYRYELAVRRGPLFVQQVSRFEEWRTSC